MQQSSDDLPDGPSPPKLPSSSEGRSFSIRGSIIVFALLFLPLTTAFLLKSGIGVADDRKDAFSLEANFQIRGIGVSESRELQFGKLYFAKFRIHPETLASFRNSLDQYKVSVGDPSRPTTLALERPWWDPVEQGTGTTWRVADKTVFSPDSQPDLFYLVQELPEQ